MKTAGAIIVVVLLLLAGVKVWRARRRHWGD